MYTLKSIVRRGPALGGALALLIAAVVPTAAVFADALNPLTERSLTLSSSAPGFIDTDGSGNATYAPPGSGPNGKKTGETFSFKVSTDSVATGKTIKAFTLQYCMTAAGYCQAPGNNQGDYDPNDDGTYTDSTREDNDDAHPLGRSDLDVVGTFTNPSGATPAAGEFVVLVDGVQSTGWTMTAINAESENTSLVDNTLTGKKNMIQLTNTGGGATPTAGQRVQIIFKASAGAYITNPGDRSFFVKINTYDSATSTDLIPDVPAETNTHIIDGGVTVANVMTDSIHITTKVLETMSFSVGTRNRDNVTLNCAGYPSAATIAAGCEDDDTSASAVHRTCDPIQNVNNNRLNLGNPNAEYSLETGKAWDVYSYWRLSSNSSGGATVYYSGNTLANTVGDEIAQMPTEAVSTPGTEQFGLGFVDATTEDTPSAEFQAEITGDPTRFKEARSFPFRTVNTQTANEYAIGSLPAQPVSTAYDEAYGTIDNGSSGPGSAKFKFLKSSLTTPEPIAQQNDQVISCATAKMRYVGNIGADTPAGVYTTKINYLAAPQY